MCVSVCVGMDVRVCVCVGMDVRVWFVCVCVCVCECVCVWMSECGLYVSLKNCVCACNI